MVNIGDVRIPLGNNQGQYVFPSSSQKKESSYSKLNVKADVPETHPEGSKQ